MKMASPEEALAETFVFWDMKQFPVPSGFDALQVLPCITRFLEKYGYSGPLTITAVGDPSRIPGHIFHALSLTGIRLYHVPTKILRRDTMSLMSHCMSENSPPANIMGICGPRSFPPPLSGYNIFRPFSYSSPHQDFILWKSLILATSQPTSRETPKGLTPLLTGKGDGN
ncbi:PREDICTED: uncharacterized protein LOC104714205 [Camelina sativa]|uniref:Uncharacterized protein LOC104714205 n=1 Tax=Camelina sativa TaxID=90675 RepID=A0ABM1QGE5_CAMSA|nr:PREDICTED: uncharacterized protein LOC104714205 [Camelina sativa]